MDVFHTFRRSGDENTGAAGASEGLTEQFLTLAEVGPSAADLTHAAAGQNLIERPFREWRQSRLRAEASRAQEEERARAHARQLDYMVSRNHERNDAGRALAEIERGRVITAKPESGLNRARGQGAATGVTGRAIKDTILTLEQGGIVWGEVPRAAFAEWLVRPGNPLAGENMETIRDNYLNKKKHAPVACPTRRQGEDQKAMALHALDVAWKRGREKGREEYLPIHGVQSGRRAI